MAHTHMLRVRWHELDPYGHVNHAVYLNYFEAARVELLDEVGWPMSRISDAGLAIVVATAQIGFHAPAVADDELTITTEVVQMRVTTSRWRQEMTRAGQPIATFDARAAILTSAGRPTRAPDDLVAALKLHLEVREVSS